VAVLSDVTHFHTVYFVLFDVPPSSEFYTLSLHDALPISREQVTSLFEDERRAELETLAAWAARSSDGSLADLPDEPSGEVWDAIAAESDLCTRLKCPHFDRCFVFQARRRAAEADVVVVNHHLLASDLAVRLASDNWLDAAVLPPYRRLILDEAHHLEDVAARHLGAQVSQVGVQRLLGRLERGGRGLLPTLTRELAEREDLLSAASRDLVTKGLVEALRSARRWADELVAHLARGTESQRPLRRYESVAEAAATTRR